MDKNSYYSLGIDIGSTTVKIAILDADKNLVFSDYERHYANIQETLVSLLKKAHDKLGSVELCPMITGSGGLALSEHLKIPFVQEVVAVSTALEDYAPQTDVAIELGGEDAKIIYFTNGIEPVSYTHLDVYKRQAYYTHFIYKVIVYYMQSVYVF